MTSPCVGISGAVVCLDCWQRGIQLLPEAKLRVLERGDHPQVEPTIESYNLNENERPRVFLQYCAELVRLPSEAVKRIRAQESTSC